MEFADENFITAVKKGERKIKMCDDNGKPFISKLYNVIFSQDLWD